MAGLSPDEDTAAKIGKMYTAATNIYGYQKQDPTVWQLVTWLRTVYGNSMRLVLQPFLPSSQTISKLNLDPEMCSWVDDTEHTPN